jgi:hypothetical protein
VRRNTNFASNVPAADISPTRTLRSGNDPRTTITHTQHVDDCGIRENCEVLKKTPRQAAAL